MKQRACVSVHARTHPLHLPAQVAAAAAARRCVASVVSGALSLLQYRGHFADPVRAEVLSGVMPGLLAAVGARATRAADAAGAVDSVLGAALAAGAAAVAARLAEEEEARRPYLIKVFVKLPAALSQGLAPGEAVVGGGAVPTITEAEVEDDEEEEEEEGEAGEAASPRKARRLAAAASGAVVVVVGPVAVTRRDPVQAVEERIYEWIQAAAARAEAEGGGGPGGAQGQGMLRVLALALGRPLHLYLRGARLPPQRLLLDWPLQQLADLELRPHTEAAASAAAAAPAAEE